MRANDQRLRRQSGSRRAPLSAPILLAFVLALPAFAGCIAQDDLTADAVPATAGIDVAAVEVPERATLEAIERGVAFVWKDLAFPFEVEFVVPPGATLVETTAHLTSDQVRYQLIDAETGRRKCDLRQYVYWNEPFDGIAECAAVTYADDLPATWAVKAAYPGSAEETFRATELRVELKHAEADGLLAHLDLDRISRRTHDLLPTESLTVESFDGTPLYVEVTRPDVEGPLPVVLASSPYNGPDHAAGRPAMWEYFVQDWAQRGYAVVVADVRGFGNSGGCVEVWGVNEQKDQVALVEWAAAQPWSNGRVGFYGQSYVATTPVEAAVRAPEALKAIIAVAPVNDAYRDWHYGGVPNGESLLSPLLAYQLEGLPTDWRTDDPAALADAKYRGLCDPTITARANDPRAIYNAFYEERNLTDGAGNIRAATLYTQGFFDRNVKSSNALDFFNAITAPKLGLFGHWAHQHPRRADTEVLFLAWMDQYVKGVDVGADDLPPAAILTNVGTERLADAWPPVAPDELHLFPDFGRKALGAEPAVTSADVVLTPTMTAATTSAMVQMLVERDLHVAGKALLHLDATLTLAENAHVAAFLYDDGPDGTALVTWGMANLAHRYGHDRYEPVAPGEHVRMALPFLPTEHVVEAGHTLRLVIRGADVNDWGTVRPAEPGVMTLHGDAQGVRLEVPLAPTSGVAPQPVTSVV